MTDRPEFSIEIHQNPYLPVHGTEVHAIARVRAEGEAPARPAARRAAAEVIIVDSSGSMLGERLVAAKRAAQAAVAALREDVDFAVISGASDAAMVYPRDRLLARASPSRKADAHRAISKLSAGGGTRIGRWLTLAGELFAEEDHQIRHAVLLTDGKNEHETPQELDEALERCARLFVCDSRGVGADWEPAELRRVASRLLGGFGMVADTEDLAADFTAMIEQAMGKAVADVALRVRTPHDVALRFFKQVYPSLRDLGPGKAADEHGGPGPRTVEFATGIWGAEYRDYHLCVSVPPGEPDEEMMAAQVFAVLPGTGGGPDTPLADGRVLAKWTQDEAQSTRQHPSVLHHMKQEELDHASQRLRAAHEDGDEEAAADAHEDAVRLAAETGNEEVSRVLVRMADPATGAPRPSPEIDRADLIGLDTRASESARPAPPHGPDRPEHGADRPSHDPDRHDGDEG